MEMEEYTAKGKYKQKDTKELLGKIKIPRKIEELKEGFYLLVNNRKYRFLFIGKVIKIIKIDKTAENIKVIMFFGPESVTKARKEGDIRKWHDKQDIKNFSSLDFKYLGITTTEKLDPKDDVFCYYLVPLEAKESEQALEESKVKAEELDIPLF